MWVIGAVLIYLAIVKEMEPTLLLPMGFGAILVNLPLSGAVEILEILFNAGIANELFPLILFPIVITIIAGLVAPASVALVGFLMFGNLIRECGVRNSISETAQNALANLITIFLGITIALKMQADQFLQFETLLIMGLGLVAFIVDTAGGVLFAKILNIFLKNKFNPMIGAAGISASPCLAVLYIRWL